MFYLMYGEPRSSHTIIRLCELEICQNQTRRRSITEDYRRGARRGTKPGSRIERDRRGVLRGNAPIGNNTIANAIGVSGVTKDQSNNMRIKSSKCIINLNGYGYHAAVT